MWDDNMLLKSNFSEQKKVGKAKSFKIYFNLELFFKCFQPTLINLSSSFKISITKQQMNDTHAS